MKTLVLMLALAADPPMPANGSAVTAVIEIGGITVEMPARLIPCARGRQCAQLRSGRRAQGHLEGDRFLVEDAP